ncbi:crotonobetaine/carnitine-CoA ligase [Antricoccus suffuscus]|uniref:Crotonobetaine/carnitine-CoA ligase n=1 Tax=Antricoccus suffuscus TaxID=1629062 RepID=A0A2T0ZZ57_9ACTN|nr:AMP-binding protein [Antricoccus suffuscus]PRZ41564.1 crotonobetaine/carnitine-CoA ligase [Antricoccus suffuscus]
MDLIGERNLRDLLTERANRYPDKTYLVFEDQAGNVLEYTYAEFLIHVQSAAAGFASLGIAKGDAVVIQLPNCPEFLFAWFGIGWIGAIAVPSNTANTAPEMRHILDLSDAVAVVCSPPYRQVIDDALESADGVRHRILARMPGAAPEGWTSYDEMVAVHQPAADVAVGSEDVMQMIFTSGTTSQPKAVMLTHANCLHSGERASRCTAVSDSDRVLTALPAFHVNAQSLTVLAALTVGATCVLLEEYRASKFWDQIRRHEATAVSLVAMQVRTLLAQPAAQTDRDHAVRRNFYAINVLDSEKAEFERRFGLELVNGYGLSETMTVVTIAPVFGEKRWPSIGLPAYDRQVRIVDADGEDVPTGDVGEIIVSGIPGRTIMKGYFKDPEATAQAIRDGWFYSGDNGYVDEKGYVYFFDRQKDVIKRAGENISASEVEAALLLHDHILEAAVIGVPDPIRDEAVKAFVVIGGGVELTADQIIEHCGSRLAPFKVPTLVEFVDSLPKTSVGKIEKKALRASESGAR